MKGTTKTRKWHRQLWPGMNSQHRHLSISSHLMKSMTPSKERVMRNKGAVITNPLTQPCNQERIWSTTIKCWKQNLQSRAYSIWTRFWQNSPSLWILSFLSTSPFLFTFSRQQSARLWNKSLRWLHKWLCHCWILNQIWPWAYVQRLGYSSDILS